MHVVLWNSSITAYSTQPATCVRSWLRIRRTIAASTHTHVYTHTLTNKLSPVSAIVPNLLEGRRTGEGREGRGGRGGEGREEREVEGRRGERKRRGINKEEGDRVAKLKQRKDNKHQRTVHAYEGSEHQEEKTSRTKTPSLRR